MPDTRFDGIIRWPEGGNFSVCIGDRYLIIFLIYDIKNYFSSFVISFLFDILCRNTTFSERHSMFFGVVQKWRHLWNLEFWLHF